MPSSKSLWAVPGVDVALVTRTRCRADRLRRRLARRRRHRDRGQARHFLGRVGGKVGTHLLEERERVIRHGEGMVGKPGGLPGIIP
ncbi:MAG: hypothetical protein H0U23_04195, partial [Blastocatellia bacterium]|nr:hypothetical protein [Blastocatellia bacterium]